MHRMSPTSTSGGCRLELTSSSGEALSALRMRLVTFLALFLAGAFFQQHQVCGQTSAAGFITIDCGSTIATPYRDASTGLVYTGDAAYVSTGVPASVTSRNGVSTDLSTLRFFSASNTSVKNCFEVPVSNDTTYLVRTWFYFGSYATPPASGFINFQLALDSSLWTDVRVDVSANGYYLKEAIIRTSKPGVSVCLIRKDGGGDPFISTLELRPLPSTTYLRLFDDPYAQFLDLFYRSNFGGQGTVRFPQDVFDRVWPPLSTQDLTTVLAPNYPNQTIGYNNSFSFNDLPPSIVMESAFTGSYGVNYTLGGVVTPALLYVSLFFAELNSSLPGKRVMDVEFNFLDGQNLIDLSLAGPPFTVYQYIWYDVKVTTVPDNTLTIFVNRSSSSAADALVNAAETYYIKPVSKGTSKPDADVLASLKTVIGFVQWTGDPCFPVPWDEVNCIQDRVTSLNLSGKNLTGTIPDDIGQLTALTSLNLSSNGFTGSLPVWVGELSSLDILDVSNNQLSGTFPATYITSISIRGQGTGFRYSGNSQLRCVDSGNAVCPAQAGLSPPVAPSPPSESPPSGAESSSSSSIGPIIGGIVGAILFIVVAGGLLIWFCRRRRPAHKPPPGSESYDLTTSTIPSPLHMSVLRKQSQQPYTLSAIKEATNNFARKIGEGGFGPVYFGILPNKQEVAVKLMSGKTQQGFTEFVNEIELLSTVHYKKLVSLIGYCQEGNELILLYEYMSGGDLRNRLYGPQAVQNPLNWRQRLQISLDAAKGLEYLHHGCQPSIIHRDVKSSNILLSSKLEAKVADFGLSKLTDDGQTHVMTMVKGTLGYLDPEYNSTGMLTEKSDVYSFGVVLLEIMCGQPPIAKEGPQKFIVDRVRRAMSTGALERIVDPALRGDYRLESVWRYAEIAMSCVQVTTGSRPYMNKLVSDLTQAGDIEFGSQQRWTANSDTNSETTLFSNTSYSNTSSQVPDQLSQTFHSDDQPRPY